jgi:hypothetical protein
VKVSLGDSTVYTDAGHCTYKLEQSDPTGSVTNCNANKSENEGKGARTSDRNVVKKKAERSRNKGCCVGRAICDEYTGINDANSATILGKYLYPLYSVY